MTLFGRKSSLYGNLLLVISEHFNYNLRFQQLNSVVKNSDSFHSNLTEIESQIKQNKRAFFKFSTPIIVRDISITGIL